MSKDNWAQRYSNEEKVVFQKGIWTLTEDGEKVWSLYNKGTCVSPVLDFNKYKLFDKGFLLYVQEGNINSFALYSESDNDLIFQISGEDISFEIDKDLLIFKNKNSLSIAYEINSLTKLTLDDEDQLCLDI